MLENFISTGQMQVRKSCTESIQTFHKPKNHYQGEPLTAEILGSNKRRVSDDVLSDPRPEEYRNNPGYTDYVKNQVINYCASVSENIGFRYLIKKADMQTASKDHDYCRLPFMEYWVDKATQVTDDKVRQIEEQTRLQSKSTYWMHQRMWRLTASRFGDIWKLTSRRNLLRLCKSLECTTSKNKRPLLHGRNYESKAIKAFEVKTGLKTKKCGLFVCQEIPCLGASPDAVIDDNEIVEVKCPYSGRDQDIKPGACFKFLKYGDDNKMVLKENHNYYFQIQGQLFISKRKYCHFVVYTFRDLFVKKIEIDKDYCMGSLVPKLQSFYEKTFRPYIAPTI